MADQNTVQVTIGADASGVRRGAKEASDAVGGILDRLKEFKSETVQTGREARFFANELAAIVPGAGTAKAALQDLIAAGLAGGGIGAALEGVKLAAHYFNELAAEEKKAAEELKKFAVDGATHVAQLREQIEGQIAAMRGASELDLQYRRELGPLQEQERDLITQIMSLEGGLAGAKAAVVAVDEMTFVMQQGLIAGDEHEIETKKKVLDEVQKQIAARAVWLDLKAREMAQNAEDNVSTSALLADLTARQQRLAEATKRAIDERHRQMDEAVKNTQAVVENEKTAEKAELDRIRRVHEAEAAENIALQKHDEDRLKQRQEMDALAKAADLAEAERRKKIAVDFVKPIEQAFATAVRSMIMSGKSFTDAMQSMMLGLVDAVVSGFLKMGAQAVIAAITGKAAAKVAAIGENEGNIAVAVSGAAASQAMIPFVGPELAAVAAANMDALLHGMTLPLLSAAGGIDRVPRDTLAMVHKDETVLSAGYAEGMRQLLANGGGGGGLQIHLHGTVIDAKSVETFVRSSEFRMAMQRARGLGELR